MAEKKDIITVEDQIAEAKEAKKPSLRDQIRAEITQLEEQEERLKSMLAQTAGALNYARTMAERLNGQES